jgi:hypothetical protein
VCSHKGIPQPDYLSRLLVTIIVLSEKYVIEVNDFSISINENFTYTTTQIAVTSNMSIPKDESRQPHLQIVLLREVQY